MASLQINEEFLRFIVRRFKKSRFSELFFVSTCLFALFWSCFFRGSRVKMPGAGLEPAWKIRQILSLLRLPFRHPGANYYKCSTARAKVKGLFLKKHRLFLQKRRYPLVFNAFSLEKREICPVGSLLCDGDDAIRAGFPVPILVFALFGGPISRRRPLCLRMVQPTSVCHGQTDPGQDRRIAGQADGIRRGRSKEKRGGISTNNRGTGLKNAERRVML